MKIADALPKPANVLFLDIENPANLNADFAVMTHFGYAVNDGLADVLCASDTSRWRHDVLDDYTLSAQARKVICAADMLVTWYGSRHDIPFLNSRLLLHRLQPIPRLPHIDLWRTCKYQLKLHSNRLSSAAAFMGLTPKLDVPPITWQRAAAGHRKSLAILTERCRTDVEILRQAYLRLRPLIPNHPNINLAVAVESDNCPYCGFERCAWRGKHIAPIRRRERFQCLSCGAYFTRREEPD